jgi:hypothetical protein
MFNVPADSAISARKQELVERYDQMELRQVEDMAYLDDENENDEVIIDAFVPMLNENDDDMYDEAYLNIDVTMHDVLMADDSEKEQSDDEF